jgi:endonuclease YncB( thermonuclease family)
MVSIKVLGCILAAFVAGTFAASTQLRAYAAIDIEVTQNANVIVQAKLANHGVALRDYVFIIQVEDESGIVVFLDYKSGSIPRYLDQTESITWKPGNDDIYRIKAFVWSDLENPTSLQSFIRELRIDADEETKALCSGSAACFTGVVTDIIDGDTLDVGDVRVRLSLVDTPERDEDGYSQATEYASEICPVGSRVVIDQDDGQMVDDFGRVLAKVTCKGNWILNYLLLESGHASVLTEYCAESEFSSESWIEQECSEEEAPAVQEPPIQQPLVQEPPAQEPPEENCHPSYPGVCIPPPPPDLLWRYLLQEFQGCRF